MCLGFDCGVCTAMNGWMLSFGFEAINHHQVHVDAFRRHMCCQLHLNRPDASNVETAKVKVEKGEGLEEEDGVAAKAKNSHNNVKGWKAFNSMKDIPGGY